MFAPTNNNVPVPVLVKLLPEITPLVWPSLTPPPVVTVIAPSLNVKLPGVPVPAPEEVRLAVSVIPVIPVIDMFPPLAFPLVLLAPDAVILAVIDTLVPAFKIIFVPGRPVLLDPPVVDDVRLIALLTEMLPAALIVNVYWLIVF